MVDASASPPFAATVPRAHERLGLAARRLAHRLLGSRLARAGLAAALLAMHVGLIALTARVRLGRPFNVAPNLPPAIARPDAPFWEQQRDDRLAVSRWDAVHYVGLALRGFSACPPQDMRRANLALVVPACDFKFYPTYSLLGGALGRALGVGVDWGLFFVALMAGFTVLYLWTSPPLVARLGPGRVFLSLLLLNVFPSAFHLASIHTEGLIIACGLGAFVALLDRRYVLAGFLAGAGSSVHFRGTGLTLACGAALLASLLHDPPARAARPRRAWAARAIALLISGWGGLAVALTYAVRYRDPLLYFHAGKVLTWTPRFYDGTKTSVIFGGLKPPFALYVLVLVLFIIALRVRPALRRFSAPERWFILVWCAFEIGLPVAIIRADWMGITRYTLCAFPIFWLMAESLRRRRAALAFWVLLSTAHYWNVELCTFISFKMPYNCPCYKY